MAIKRRHKRAPSVGEGAKAAAARDRFSAIAKKVGVLGSRIQPLLQALVERLNQSLATETPLVQLAAMANLVVKTDTGYKNAPFNKGDEFVATEVRIGARNKLIFTFKPFEGEYTHVEVPEDKVFAAFPALEETLRKSFEKDGYASFNGVSIDGGLPEIFEVFFQQVAKNRLWDKEDAAAAVEQEKVATNAYESNPIWGLF
jgi:hypothetical protein